MKLIAICIFGEIRTKITIYLSAIVQDDHLRPQLCNLSGRINFSGVSEIGGGKLDKYELLDMELY
jgi:hypothetical protein